MTGVCGLVSILTYMAICVERYIVIVCPLHASKWCTRSRILLVINSIWAFAIMYRLPYFDLVGTEKHEYGCFLEFLPFHWVSEFVFIHLSVFIISATLYYKTCKVLWSMEVLDYTRLNERKIRQRRKVMKTELAQTELARFVENTTIEIKLLKELVGRRLIILVNCMGLTFFGTQFDCSQCKVRSTRSYTH
ncbi:hypothetical protein niasHT_026624 [Heterodera trifolii]|uniref:G-protein coupled receptors family 1 profile domain-containing protein n=1 Tax=Heterodera trifolii TaxID=157864 RepID=A0ABD2KU43_9BILA